MPSEQLRLTEESIHALFLQCPSVSGYVASQPIGGCDLAGPEARRSPRPMVVCLTIAAKELLIRGQS